MVQFQLRSIANALIFSAALISFSGCASLLGENNDPNACRVWTEEGHSPDKVVVENEVAFFGAGCITGRIGCKWKEAKFEGNDIVVEGELSGRVGKVATMKDGQFIHLPHTGIFSSSVQKTFQKMRNDRVEKRSRRSDDSTCSCWKEDLGPRPIRRRLHVLADLLKT